MRRNPKSSPLQIEGSMLRGVPPMHATVTTPLSDSPPTTAVPDCLCHNRAMCRSHFAYWFRLPSVAVGCLTLYAQHKLQVDQILRSNEIPWLINHWWNSKLFSPLPETQMRYGFLPGFPKQLTARAM